MNDGMFEGRLGGLVLEGGWVFEGDLVVKDCVW